MIKYRHWKSIRQHVTVTYKKCQQSVAIDLKIGKDRQDFNCCDAWLAVMLRYLTNIIATLLYIITTTGQHQVC